MEHITRTMQALNRKPHIVFSISLVMILSSIQNVSAQKSKEVGTAAVDKNHNHVWRYVPKTSSGLALRYYNSGAVAAKHGKFRESLIALDQAVKTDPSFAEAHFRRGDALLELDKLNEAYTDFSTTIKLEPKHYPAYKRRARLNYEKGRLNEAISDYTNAARYADDPIEKAEILKLRAKIHSTAKKYDLSIADYTQSLALNRTPQTLMQRGNQYFSLKQYQQAVNDYSAALPYKVEKLQERLYAMRADAYVKLGKFDLAKQDRKSAKSLVDDSWGSVLKDMDKQTGL